MDNPFTPPLSFADDPSFRAFVRQTDPAAVHKWTEWLARHPDRSADVAEATRLVQQLDAYQPRRLSEMGLDREIGQLHRRLAREAGEPTLHRTAGQSPIRRFGGGWRKPPLLRVAAAVVVLLTAYALYRDNQLIQSPTITSVAGRATTQRPLAANAPLNEPVRKRLTQTEYGQRRTLRLPDGSVVTLNAHSTLTLSPNWATGNREVWLTGEAFFRVSKQQKNGKPVKFVVRANNVAVDVLGTQFDVSTRNRRVKVVLNEGRIRLNVLTSGRHGPAPVRTLDMLPGDLVEVSDRQTITLSNRVETASHSAWVTGELIFDETPLSEVAQLINDNYGYEVEFANPSLAGRRLTATLPDKNVDVLLTALEKIFALSITRQNKTIRLATAAVVIPD